MARDARLQMVNILIHKGREELMVSRWRALASVCIFGNHHLRKCPPV